MNKINKQLIKAGLCYLIDKDKESFINRLSLYLQERSELMNFFFEGPLPINEEIKQELEEYMKRILPSPEYFKEITEISIDFDYYFKQQYKVTYKVTYFIHLNKKLNTLFGEKVRNTLLTGVLSFAIRSYTFCIDTKSFEGGNSAK